MPSPYWHDQSGWQFISPFPGTRCPPKQREGCREKSLGDYDRDYDIIHRHSILDVPNMQRHLRASALHPLFFTVLRRPADRAVSALNYGPWVSLSLPSIKGRNTSWPAILSALEKKTRLPAGSGAKARAQRGAKLCRAPCSGGGTALFVNSMAYDLGWYVPANGSTAHDHDDVRITAWLRRLDKQLGFVMLMERFDEGLVRAFDLSLHARTHRSVVSIRIHRSVAPQRRAISTT